jgi:hypothetical protein
MTYFYKYVIYLVGCHFVFLIRCGRACGIASGFPAQGRKLELFALAAQAVEPARIDGE